MSDHAQTVATAVAAFNDGDVDRYFGTLYTEDAVFHGYPPHVPPTRDGVAAHFRALRAGVPDAHVAIEDLFVSGDRVALRYTMTGTHTGGLLGVPGTGAALRVEGITILRFRDGRCAERWNRLDDLALLTQIGALPTPVA